MGVHQQTLWNRSVRGQMPPAEEPGLYRRTGNRKLYRIDAVLGWLPGGDGPTPWDWARRYLGSAWHIPPEHLDDRERMLQWIAETETWRHISRPWRWRSVPAGLERLRQDYLVAELVPSGGRPVAPVSPVGLP